jgi:heme/copper-type cytochrome/quinol oxidase subunit 2
VRPRHRGRSIARAASAVLFAFVVALAFAAPAALAADVSPGWGQWWLPPDRSTHGHQMDSLFHWIFWITMITFVGVELLLVYFLIKYRARPERKKAVFTHGNTRLEMAWTLAPALILAVLALASKKVWDNYRYSASLVDPDRAKVLVIGERFKWNVIYPGPDGEFGRYMVYPSPSDPRWPDGQPYDGVEGPAMLPYDKAVQTINRYNDARNKLGKDHSDPAGKDDDYQASLARDLVIPVGRPVEVQLTSKDVIHDFFLPNFRVKLDAVPGMRGRVIFTPTITSKDFEQSSRKPYKIDELVAAVKRPENRELTVVINEGAPGAELYKPPRGSSYWRYADKDKKTIVRNEQTITPEVAEKLKAAGVQEVNAYLPAYWDLVCEELCGEGHAKMQGRVIVLSQEEYDAKKWDKKPGAAPPTTAPAIALK